MNTETDLSYGPKQEPNSLGMWQFLAAANCHDLQLSTQSSALHQSLVGSKISQYFIPGKIKHHRVTTDATHCIKV